MLFNHVQQYVNFSGNGINTDSIIRGSGRGSNSAGGNSSKSE